MKRREFLKVTAGVSCGLIPLTNSVAFADLQQKNQFLHVIVCKLDSVNGNNRIYPKAEIQKMIDHFNKYNNGQYLGELWINNSKRTDYIRVLFSQVSHQLKTLEIVGNRLIAGIQILNTPNGKYLWENIDKFEFRLRPITDVVDGKLTNIKLVAVDAIPSFDAVPL